jgi:hypothetical protein
MTAVLLETWQDWECPNCYYTERTRPLPANASRMHECPALHGLVAPLVLEGADCKVTAVERGDYLRDEEQRTGDDGIPYMAVRTDHGDGRNDLAVFAPVATFGARRNKR